MSRNIFTPSPNLQSLIDKIQTYGHIVTVVVNQQGLLSVTVVNTEQRLFFGTANLQSDHAVYRYIEAQFLLRGMPDCLNRKWYSVGKDEPNPIYPNDPILHPIHTHHISDYYACFQSNPAQIIDALFDNAHQSWLAYDADLSYEKWLTINNIAYWRFL